MAEPTLLEQAREHIGPSRHIECRDHLDRGVDCILRYLEARHEAGPEPPQVVAEPEPLVTPEEAARIDESVRENFERAQQKTAAMAAKLDAASARSVALDLDELQRLQRLCDAATPGSGTFQANDRFLAEIRDALPKLIAEVRRLRTMPVCSECNDLRDGARCGVCGEFIEDRDTEDGDAF